MITLLHRSISKKLIIVDKKKSNKPLLGLPEIKFQ